MVLNLKTVLLWFLGICMLFPLFIQIDGGIYNEYVPMVDSLGLLTHLPLPISLFASIAIFVLLPGNFKRADIALAMIAGVVLVSLVSLWLGEDGVTSLNRKLLLTVQILLPLTGLLLGQLIEDRQKIIARAFLIVLSFIVPLQLLVTWFQGGLILTHYLYVFSIYSHFQYVTLIFVCAYAFALTSLWDEYKIWLCVLALLMLIYALAGLSFLTIGAFALVVSVFFIQKVWVHRNSGRQIFICMVILAACVASGVIYFEKMYTHETSSAVGPDFFKEKFKRVGDGKVPVNLAERFGDWRLFGSGIIESPKTMFVGHPQPMPREIRSSPHNWYIDTAYTFGLLGLLPVFMLTGYTAHLCWRKRKNVPSQVWWLTAIVFYLVIIDSNFKVTLRQPYPGIFTYFLWGLLLSRLREPSHIERAAA